MFTKILTNHVLTAFVIFVLATLFVIGVTGFKILPNIAWGFYDLEFWGNVLVEAHGMLLDILVIGVFILWLNKKGEKFIANQRYLDEIDDFRGWRSEEAARRIRGNILRLNRNGISKIDLSRCFLQSIELNYVNLNGAKLIETDLKGADLYGANLEEADMSCAVFEETLLHQTNLKKVNLSHAYLKKAKITNDTKLEGAFYDSRTSFPDWLDSDQREKRGMIFRQ